MVLAADDYFDLNIYHQRVKRSREAWAELLTGKRSCLVFMNLCAPFLCDLFGVEPRDYYTDLEVMADTQLKGIAWRLEHLDEGHRQVEVGRVAHPEADGVAGPDGDDGPGVCGGHGWG